MENFDITLLQNIAYIFAAILFITGIKMLGKEATAQKGNIISAVGMFIAIIVTAINIVNPFVVLGGILLGAFIGSVIAVKVKMTSIPEMVALFNGFGGLATFFIAWSEMSNTNDNLFQYLLVILTIYIGGVTFSGSLIAFGKLSERLKIGKGHLLTNLFISIFYISLVSILAMLVLPMIGSLPLNFETIFYVYLALVMLGGVGFVLPIGGGDMPVVISLLNSLSGIAAAFAGLILVNNVLIVAGSLVGASGLILTVIMAKAMNRTIGNILFVGYAASATSSSSEQGEVKPINAEVAFLILENASSVLIVPGYGMAVAQAQHALKEMVDTLKKNDIKVSYAIHPVAGRMPGHMNVLLAEANVPYDEVFELEEINNDFANADVAFVIGANDVTNPVAKTDPQSPIYGMPILDVEKCKSVLFVKRSLSPGYAGIDNDRFYKENTLMLFADAKKMTEEISKAL